MAAPQRIECPNEVPEATIKLVGTPKSVAKNRAKKTGSDPFLMRLLARLGTQKTGPQPTVLSPF
jgi:hypothetical protein